MTTQLCKTCIKQNVIRCDICAEKYAERLHAYKANEARRQQLEEWDSVLMSEDRGTPSPRAYYKQPLTLEQTLRLFTSLPRKAYNIIAP